MSWWRIIRVVGGLVVLGGLAWQVRPHAAMAALAAVDLRAVAAALGIGLATTLVCAWRWRVVAAAVGVPIPIRVAVADYYRAVFLNAVLPAGVLGDVHRAACHGRESGAYGRAARAVVLERVAGQAVLLAAGAVVLLFMPLSLAQVAPDDLPAVALGAVTVIAVSCVVLGAVHAMVRHQAWWESARRQTRVAVADARAALFSRRTGPAVLLMSVAAVGGHVALFLVSARVATPQSPVSLVLPIAVLALVAMSIPLNVAGWGPREAVAVLAFGALGLAPELGFATAVTYGALALVASLPGLGVLLFRRVLTGDRREVAQRREMSGEGPDQVAEHEAALVGRGE